ncbi:hypothetical protein IMY05_C4844000100 [Salix suchowensis]|nr:hypothetical protein IMY05_C4844000100 [Salix suchowensis]
MAPFTTGEGADCDDEEWQDEPTAILIDRLAEFFGLLLTQMSKLLKMHISLLVGGPEPKHGGNLNVLSARISPSNRVSEHGPNDCKAASLSPAEMAQYRLAYGDDKAPVDAPTYNNNGPVTQSQPTYVQLKLKLKPIKVLTPSSSKRYSSKRPSEIQISKGRWVALAASKIGPPRGAKCAAASSSEINEPAPKCQGPILSPSSSPPMSTINACLDPPSASPHEPIASTSESPLDLPVHNLPHIPKARSMATLLPANQRTPSNSLLLHLWLRTLGGLPGCPLLTSF